MPKCDSNNNKLCEYGIHTINDKQFIIVHKLRRPGIRFANCVLSDNYRHMNFNDRQVILFNHILFLDTLNDDENSHTETSHFVHCT